jgi:NAD(P)H-hydrate epimerase
MKKQLTPILDPIQTKELEQINIAKQQINSWDLMERAANIFTNWFLNSFPKEDQNIAIFCGSGNNGGDGLAIARLLSEQFRAVDVFIYSSNQLFSQDNLRNQALLDNFQVNILKLTEENPLPSLDKHTFIIDAIFGIGLNRPLDGFYLDLIGYINNSNKTIISVDIPSGLFAHQASYPEMLKVQANFTVSFGFPKLAFLFPENDKFIGKWIVKDLNFEKDSHLRFDTKLFYLDRHFIKSLVKKREKFSHKGNFGHALLICGSYGKIGAALLAGEACLRSGCGLLTIHVPKIGYNIIQSKFPEAMVSIDRHEHNFSECPNLDNFSAIGVGCGLGQGSHVEKALKTLLETSKVPLVLDADALNLIAKNKWLELIPKNSIITPHVKEFKRLFGNSS